MDFEWKDGVIQEIEILSKAGEICKLYLPLAKYELRDAKAKQVAVSQQTDKADLMIFPTKRGERYTIVIQ